MFEAFEEKFPLDIQAYQKIRSGLTHRSGKKIAQMTAEYDWMPTSTWGIKKRNPGLSESLLDKIHKLQKNGAILTEKETRTFLLLSLTFKKPVIYFLYGTQEEKEKSSKKILEIGLKNLNECQTKENLNLIETARNSFQKELDLLNEPQTKDSPIIQLLSSGKQITSPPKQDNLKSIKRKNPYQELEPYDVEDSVCFYGRDHLCERAIQHINHCFEDNNSPIIALIGESGCGKSSFMRAGILARLKTIKNIQSFESIIITPEKLKKSLEIPESSIRIILSKINQDTSLEIPRETIKTICKNKTKRADKAIKELAEKHLAQDDKKLIICLDQFEELFEQLSQIELQREWSEFIDFISIAAKSPHFAFIYTIRNASMERLNQSNALPKHFTNAYPIYIDREGEEFYREIICKPFEAGGYKLENRIVDSLVNNTHQFRNIRSWGSSLPLLSVKLFRLFDRVFELKGEPVQNSTKSNFNEQLNLITMDDIQEDTDIQTEITELAEAAWQEATESDEISLEDLNFFLRPFIKLSDEGKNSIILKPAIKSMFHSDLKIVEKFEEYRLMVPSSNNTSRLMHEAVVRLWNKAEQWLDENIDSLKTEAQFLIEAKDWKFDNFSEDFIISKIKNDDKKIDKAANILNNYLRYWPFANENLPKEDLLLKDFCIAVFSENKSPDQKVRISNSKNSYIHIAAHYNCHELLRKYSKINPDSLNLETKKTKRTPIFYAAWNSIEAIKFLLSNDNVDHAPEDDDEFYPITAPITTGNDTIFRLLLPYHLKKSKSHDKNKKLLQCCAISNRVDFAKILIKEHKLSPEVRSENEMLPIHIAALYGSLEMFKLLLTDTPWTEVNGAKRNCLHLAALKGHTNIVEEIITQKDFIQNENAIDEKGMTALMLASIHLNSSTVALLAPFTSINQKIPEDDYFFGGQTALHLAINNIHNKNKYNRISQSKCHKTIIELLKNDLTDPNIKDTKGDSPLTLAKESHAIINLLLHDHRVSPVSASGNGRDFPIYIAAKKRLWAQFLKMLDRLKPNQWSITDKNGDTLLHVAAKNNANSDVITKIVQHPHIKTDMLNKEAATPLLLAIQNKAQHAIETLIQKPYLNANLKLDVYGSHLHEALKQDLSIHNLEKIKFNKKTYTLKDSEGWTPLHIIAIKDNKTLFIWLKNTYGKTNELEKIKDKLGRTPAAVNPNSSLFKRTAIPKNKLIGHTWDENYNWTEFNDKQNLDLFLEKLKHSGHTISLDENAIVKVSNLPFYRSNSLHIVSIHRKGMIEYWIHYEQEMIALKGDSSPIHRLNAELPIKLTEENAIDYLHFFCFFVRSKNIPFLITEKKDGYETESKLSEKDRNALKKFARPAIITEHLKAKGEFKIEAILWHWNIFFAQFTIHRSGMISMDSDIILHEMDQNPHYPI